jgi:superfamily II DNA or RNA helicase
MRDYQIEAFNLPLAQSPIQMGIIKAATNAGKSYPIASMGIAAVKADLPILIMVHNELIFNQLYDELSKFIEVGRVNSKFTDLKICTIAMEKSIANRFKKHSEIDLYLKMVRVVVVDECHRVGSNDYQLILNKLTEVSLKIGFSGTPLDGSQKNNIKVKSTFGEVLMDITNKEMMDRGISSQVIVKIHQIPYMVTKASYKEAKRLVINNRTRIAIIKDLVLRASKETLIIVEELGHAETLQKALYPFNVPILHGKLNIKKRKELLEEFYEGKYNALIATSAIQEGVNTKNIRSFIYASGYMSETKLKQYIGRTLRKKGENDTVYIYDFYDHIEHFNMHSDERIKIYNQEQFKILN